MKNISLSLLMVLMTVTSYAQIDFERGYFIDNKGDRGDCYIKNVDWESNPEEFKYKLSELGEVKIATIEDAQQFRISDSHQYIRSTVNIDRSSDEIEDLSYARKPLFEEETLFLRVLVEGKANLYFYQDVNFTRYFYNLETDSVRQLIYKSYQVREDGEYRVAENNTFRYQIWEDLKCAGNEQRKPDDKLRYTKRDMLKVFVAYNECQEVSLVDYYETQEEGRDKFNLNFRAGVSRSSMTITREYLFYPPVEYSFDDSWSFRFGIEPEFFLNFNKNKWSVILNPSFQYFKSTFTTADGVELDIAYQHVDLSAGFRHYFYLNEKSSLFLDASFGATGNILSFAKFQLGRVELDELQTEYFIPISVGFKYADRYSMLIRYNHSREVLGKYVLWRADYSFTSIVLGYSIF